MSKRPNESPQNPGKKVKLDPSQDESLNIDGELIAHQSSFKNPPKDSDETNHQDYPTTSNGSDGLNQRPAGTISIQPTTLPFTPSKPAPGTEEWHKLRRENHKEVEKRRRDNINSGIRELAAIIPTNDTNKAQILQRAVEFIKRLKENETNNIEKWTLEKLLTEQAVSELDASNNKLKQELERAYREIEHYKRLVEKKE